MIIGSKSDGEITWTFYHGAILKVFELKSNAYIFMCRTLKSLNLIYGDKHGFSAIVIGFLNWSGSWKSNGLRSVSQLFSLDNTHICIPACIRCRNKEQPNDANCNDTDTKFMYSLHIPWQDSPRTRER